MTPQQRSFEPMAVGRAALLLWLGAVLLLPLPYLMVSEGSVPVARFLFLGVVAGTYSLVVDGSGTAWLVSGVMWGHAIGYAAVLAPLAWLSARLFPARLRRRSVLGALLGLGFLLTIGTQAYVTPMDDASIRSSWLGLFQ